MTDNVAVLQGFTREVMAYADNGVLDLHLLVKPDADLDDTFKAWCCDEQEFIRVNGWLFEIEDVTPDEPGTPAGWGHVIA